MTEIQQSSQQDTPEGDDEIFFYIQHNCGASLLLKKVSRSYVEQMTCLNLGGSASSVRSNWGSLVIGYPDDNCKGKPEQEIPSTGECQNLDPPVRSCSFS
ncbi:MAG: hypothetical protein ACRDRQ_08645 [Pseudonocardiaceae bacterium]